MPKEKTNLTLVCTYIKDPNISEFYGGRGVGGKEEITALSIASCCHFCSSLFLEFLLGLDINRTTSGMRHFLAWGRVIKLSLLFLI